MYTKSIILISLFLTNFAYGESRAPIHLDSLLAISDFVGVVVIKSGMLQENIGAVYSGKVDDVIKGDSSLLEVEFGIHSGLGIGKRYLVFLIKSDSNSLQFSNVFEYETTRLNQNKDYIIRHPRPDEVVKIPTERIILPRILKSHVVDNSQTVWSKDKIDKARWVKVEELLKYLRKLLRAS